MKIAPFPSLRDSYNKVEHSEPPYGASIIQSFNSYYRCCYFLNENVYIVLVKQILSNCNSLQLAHVPISVATS